MLGEQLRIVCGIEEQLLLGGLQLPLDFLLRFEDVVVPLKLVAQFRLQFPKIRLIGLIKLGSDVGKVDHIAIPEGLIGAVHASQCLEQIVILDNTAQVLLFQSGCVKTG